MAIITVPVVSGPVLLSDVSPAVGKLEGESPKSERAWISVRQATEQDSMKLEETLPGTRIEYIDDVVDGQVVRKSVETRDDRMRILYAMQIYLTICDAGNMFEDAEQKKPVFTFENGANYTHFAGGFDSFLRRYGLLPVEATEAMRDIVYDHNPQWDWRRLYKEGEPEKNVSEAT